jgi:hypothetical protein
VKLLFRVTKATGDKGPWKVSTAAYYYALHGTKEREFLAFHWHPEAEGRTDPHLHIYAPSNIVDFLTKVHLPTGRIALEQFLRFLIVELKVKPLRDDWESVLKRTEGPYTQHRTWH